VTTSPSTHECPAPDCEEQVPFSLLACKGHWFRIPPALRSRLLNEYQNNFGERSYFEARAACLRALGVPEDEISSVNAGVV
jgi:hypothetical protein